MGFLRQDGEEKLTWWKNLDFRYTKIGIDGLKVVSDNLGVAKRIGVILLHSRVQRRKVDVFDGFIWGSRIIEIIAICSSTKESFFWIQAILDINPLQEI